jgi:hypothetical protein
MGTRVVVTCSVCGSELGLLPAFGAGEEFQRWLGSACASCGRAYCAECVPVGGSAPCPGCGGPTQEATLGALREAGVLP